MERKFLEDLDPGGGAKLPKAAIDAIMAENEKDINATKAKYADYEAIKTQLSEANKKLEGYDPEWKAKADQAERDAQAKVAEAQMEFSIREALSGVKFTSSFAKDGVAAKVKAAGLKLAEDGKSLLGLDDLMKSIREQNPDAFETEETGDKGGTTQTGGSEKLPFGSAGSQKKGGDQVKEPANLRDALSEALFPKKQ